MFLMNNSNNFFGYPAPIRAPVPFALSSQPIKGGDADGRQKRPREDDINAEDL